MAIAKKSNASSAVRSAAMKAVTAKRNKTSSSTPTSTPVGTKTSSSTSTSTPVETKTSSSTSQTYTQAVKAAGSTENLIKSVVDKYGATSTQATAIKKYVAGNTPASTVPSRATTPPSVNTTVPTTVTPLKTTNPSVNQITPVSVKNVPTPVKVFTGNVSSTPTSFSSTKEEASTKKSTLKTSATAQEAYNKVVEKGGSPDKVIKTVENKYWVDSNEAKKARGFIASQDNNKKITNISTPVEKSRVEALNKKRAEWISDENILWYTEKQFWKESEQYKKMSTFLGKNPLKTGTEWLNKDILLKKKEELAVESLTREEEKKNSDINMVAKNSIESIKVLTNNNEALQGFYAKMSTDLQDFIKKSEVTKRESLERTKTTELNRVVWQVRANLARRGINIANVSPEQLIAMSWEIWGKALENINEAITKAEDEIIALTEEKTKEINVYVEKGIIKQGEADSSIEQIRQLKEKMIADVNATYITNAFKVAYANIADQDTKNAEVLNTVSKFVQSLWITGKAQGIMEEYINATDSVQALQAMIEDLNNEDSRLYKAVADIEKAAQLAAEFEAKIAVMKASKSSEWSTKTKDSALWAVVMGQLTSYPEFANARTWGDYYTIRDALWERWNVVQQAVFQLPVDTPSHTQSTELNYTPIKSTYTSIK